MTNVPRTQTVRDCLKSARDDGHKILDLDRERTTLRVRYRSNATDEEQALNEYTSVAGSLAPIIATPTSPYDRLEATAVGPEGEAWARWHLKHDWVIKWFADELTGPEVSERITETIEPLD